MLRGMDDTIAILIVGLGILLGVVVGIGAIFSKPPDHR